MAISNQSAVATYMITMSLIKILLDENDIIVRKAKLVYEALMAGIRKYDVPLFENAYYSKYGKEILKCRIEMIQLNERIYKVRKEAEEADAIIVPEGFSKVMVTVRCDNEVVWTQARFLPAVDILSKGKRYGGTTSCVSSVGTNRKSVDVRMEQQSVRSQDHEGRSDFLLDSDNGVRGVWISLQGKDEHRVLLLLYEIYVHYEKNMGQVQAYSKYLLHYNCCNPGFPVIKGTTSSYVHEMYDILSSKIRQALIKIGYCSEDQELQLYMSFLKTLKTEVQRPHIDYHWKDISPRYFKKRPRSYNGNYEEWVPFIALFPLTQDGMTVEVWNARSNHDMPACNEDAEGVIVNIAFGEMLVLRADVVHAGGFATAVSGNPRGHFYVYKTPRGVQHAYPLSNCYDVEVSGKSVPLCTLYKHCG